MNRLLHFVAIGALLFAGRQFAIAHDWFAGEREPVRITAADVGHLRAQWLRESARAPTGEELRASVAKYADDQMLVQEALRLGLDRKDAVVRERLLLNMRFAYPDSTASDESLLAQARALGMVKRDTVLRRRLIQVMEDRYQSDTTVSERDLQAYANKHAARYGAQTRYSFRQVFLSREKHDEASARRLLDALRAGEQPTGDPFLLGDRFDASTQAEIARLIGADFANVLAAAPIGEWTGPLASTYGLHLVRVDAISVSPADLQSRRAQIAYAAQHDKEAERLREEKNRLRRDYRIVIAADAFKAPTP